MERLLTFWLLGSRKVKCSPSTKKGDAKGINSSTTVDPEVKAVYRSNLG